MDIIVKATGKGTWELIDLLGRSMGNISQSQSYFTIFPAGHAIETMQAMKTGPFPSFDIALVEIEKHTRGTCRLDGASGEATIAAGKLDAGNDE